MFIWSLLFLFYAQEVLICSRFIMTVVSWWLRFTNCKWCDSFIVSSIQTQHYCSSEICQFEDWHIFLRSRYINVLGSFSKKNADSAALNIYSSAYYPTMSAKVCLNAVAAALSPEVVSPSMETLWISVCYKNPSGWLSASNKLFFVVILIVLLCLIHLM